MATKPNPKNLSSVTLLSFIHKMYFQFWLTVMGLDTGRSKGRLVVNGATRNAQCATRNLSVILWCIWTRYVGKGGVPVFNRRVASPELKCKPKEARGLGAALGPQWVQGRALVGGSGGRSPPTENDFSKIEPNKTHRKCLFFLDF